MLVIPLFTYFQVKEPQISLTGLQQRLEDAERDFAAQQQDLQAQATELQATRDQLEQREEEAVEMREQLDGMTAKLEERDLRKNLEDAVRKKVRLLNQNHNYSNNFNAPSYMFV